MIFLTSLFTACSNKYPLDLGSDYKLDYDGNSYFYLLDDKNTVIIKSHITKFNFDSIFIIAEQKPVNLILQETYNNPEMDLKKRDKIFKESGLRHYWVIDKEKTHVYGPYKKDEYIGKREELKVNKELDFNEK